MTSKEQFRALFEKEEPALLKFLDGMIEEFGRTEVKDLAIHCPVNLGKQTTLAKKA